MIDFYYLLAGCYFGIVYITAFNFLILNYAKTHLSTKNTQAFARAWVSHAHGNAERQACAFEAQDQKKGTIDRIKSCRAQEIIMLSLQHRLRSSEDFNRIYREGGVRNCAWMGMRYCRNGKKGTRVGFVIPNSVIKHATGRNRLRRQLRAAVQKNFFSLPAGFDIFFVVKRYLSPLPFIVIEHDLLLLVYHLSMLKQNT